MCPSFFPSFVVGDYETLNYVLSFGDTKSSNKQGRFDFCCIRKEIIFAFRVYLLEETLGLHDFNASTRILCMVCDILFLEKRNWFPSFNGYTSYRIFDFLANLQFNFQPSYNRNVKSYKQITTQLKCEDGVLLYCENYMNVPFYHVPKFLFFHSIYDLFNYCFVLNNEVHV